MLNVLDLRYLIVVSSMANNGFLLLGLISGSMFVFWLFYSLYFLNMFFILYMLGGFTKLSFNQIRSKSLTTIVVLALLFNLAALPPFPMFFVKFLVLLEYFTSAPNSIYMIVILVLANVFIMASYCQLLIKYVVNNYSHSSSHLLF
jgi:formate hydrogenlyase subunit 3/multisubunit Na+/H+ antiporter MnhD subunit